MDGSSDAAPFSGEEENRREGLREKLLRSLESHRDRIAAEVDERSAELTARQAELEEEQARLVAAEATVAERAARLAELGIADDEHAAVVDRLLKMIEELSARVAAEPEPAPEPVGAGHAVSESLGARGDGSESVGAGHAPPAPTDPPAHLLFVPTGKSYLLVGRDGPAPAVGSELALDGSGRFIVSKLASSPLPADERRCAYLEALA